MYIKIQDSWKNDKDQMFQVVLDISDNQAYILEIFDSKELAEKVMENALSKTSCERLFRPLEIISFENKHAIKYPEFKDFPCPRSLINFTRLNKDQVLQELTNLVMDLFRSNLYIKTLSLANLVWTENKFMFKDLDDLQELKNVSGMFWTVARVYDLYFQVFPKYTQRIFFNVLKKETQELESQMSYMDLGNVEYNVLDLIHEFITRMNDWV